MPVCWALYLGCLAYGIYLQTHYTYHARWFRLGSWAMCFASVGPWRKNWGRGVSGAFSHSSEPVEEHDFPTAERGCRRAASAGPCSGAPMAGGRLRPHRSDSAGCPAAGGERGDLPVRLPDLRGHPRLARAPFAWSKAMPALCPIVLAGFWYLYRQTLLPRFWYQHQQELYLAVWTMAGVLALLPCLKRRHWGMLLPVLAMMLACLGFRGCWPIPRSIPCFPAG